MSEATRAFYEFRPPRGLVKNNTRYILMSGTLTDDLDESPANVRMSNTIFTTSSRYQTDAERRYLPINCERIFDYFARDVTRVAIRVLESFISDICLLFLLFQLFDPSPSPVIRIGIIK